ncbi:hypothetical protein DFH08DRAFT_1072727 [Mycena albidolilacea]|uniref:Uncharacterized protein n=1 Tax=Mycena albidolilacea TaxID=1033008 RepID=A0AAD7F134_9AGAR|nr:hypothetical protein DFH08DRAFT_1072727 [Mycena albidolilacea]
MSYDENSPSGWNTSSQLHRIDGNLPFSPSRQNNLQSPGNILAVGIQPSLNPDNRVSSNPDSSSPNVFSTGSLVAALAAPPSAPGNGAARPIRRRKLKGGRKRPGPAGFRNPSAPSRRAQAVRAAAVASRAEAIQAAVGVFRARQLNLQQEPWQRSSVETSMGAARAPLPLTVTHQRAMALGLAPQEGRRPSFDGLVQLGFWEYISAPTRHAGLVSSGSRNPAAFLSGWDEIVPRT